MAKNEYIFSDITEVIIGAAIEVHNQLGCGFLESVYEEAFAIDTRIKEYRI